MVEIKSFEERKKDLVELGKKNNNVLTFEQLAEALKGLDIDNDSLDDLYNKTKELILNVKKRKNIAKNAYLTIRNEWNAEIAAERLLKLIEFLQSKKKTNIYKDGPCSIAKNIGQNKMYKFIMGNKNDKKNNK